MTFAPLLAAPHGGQSSTNRSFKDAATARLFWNEDVPRWRAIERQARRKLLVLDGALALNDLHSPPGNRL